MPSKIEFANASEIFRLRKTGVAVPNNVLAAARKVLQGQSSKSDSEVIRNYIGIQYSGARKIRKDFANITSLTTPAQRIEQDVENVVTVASRGGNPIAAVARLSQDVARGVQDYLKNKAIKNIAEAVGKQIFGKDARAVGAALLSVRRFASKIEALSGPIGFAAEVGWRIGSIVPARWAAADLRNNSAGVSFDAARQRNINVGAFGQQSRQIREDVLNQRTYFERIRDFIGLDEDTTKEQNRRIELRANNIAGARGFVRELSGKDPAIVLANYAARKGKLVSELTAREQYEAYDQANETVLSPEVGASDPRVLAKIRGKSDAFQFNYNRVKTLREQELIREQIYEEEVLPEELAGRAKKRADDQKAAEDMHNKIYDTPEKVYQLRREMATAQANWEAERSRTRAIEYD